MAGAKCVQCGTLISWKWRAFGSMEQDYRCPQCGSVYRFTTVRYMAGIFAGMIVGIAILLKITGAVTLPFFAIFIISSILAIVVFLVFPGQFSRSGV